MWSEAQQKRLAVERAILRREMPQFEWHDPTGDTYVEGEVGTSRGDELTLRCVLGPQWPDKKPNVYVVSPLQLRKYDGSSLNADEKSHAFHTGPKGPNGEVQICHFKEEWWDASKTIVAVLTKSVIWVEAYAKHLETGHPIRAYCPE